MISCIAGSLLFGIAQRANSPAPKGAGLSLCSDLSYLCLFCMPLKVAYPKLSSKGIFILFDAQLIKRYILDFLLPDVFSNRCLVKSLQ